MDIFFKIVVFLLFCLLHAAVCSPFVKSGKSYRTERAKFYRYPHMQRGNILKEMNLPGYYHINFKKTRDIHLPYYK